MAGFVFFSGSRSLAPAYAERLRGVVSACLEAGMRPVVGCAKGADSVVRSAALVWARGRSFPHSSPTPKTVSVLSPSPCWVVSARTFMRAGRLSRASFVARSLCAVALVATCGVDGLGDSVRRGAVVFPSAPCPLDGPVRHSLLPALPAWPAGATGSGSWGSAHAVASIGLPLVIFPCGWSPDLLPSVWGYWSLISSGPFEGGFILKDSLC